MPKPKPKTQASSAQARSIRALESSDEEEPQQPLVDNDVVLIDDDGLAVPQAPQVGSSAAPEAATDQAATAAPALQAPLIAVIHPIEFGPGTADTCKQSCTRVCNPL